MSISFKLVSQRGSEVQSQADYIKVPGQTGECGIIANHSPSLVQLKPGHILVRNGKEQTVYFVKDGLAHILTDSVTILCSDFELAGNIDQAQAKATLDERRQQLADTDNDSEKASLTFDIRCAEERLYICEQLL